MQITPLFSVFSLVILIMSAAVHEVAHGWMADSLGDPTAKYQGRLTLNPLKHIDPWGSVVVPVLFYLASGGAIGFGWAKPVPYNPYNLRDQRWGELKVALAGPAVNFILAALGSIVIRAVVAGGVQNEALILALAAIVTVNLVLGLFNLIPLPPLDGSKILYAFLPFKYYAFRQNLEYIGPIFLLVIIFFLWPVISPIIGALFGLFTGL
ncbi:MAG TPA: site-2 protease family protein [Candidatus Paceibacterota bacterium]|nr:site-2 protease family protein [Candidatus Paceibacterota bacterium]